jgi:K+-transporting ATPase ATPase C chain
MLTHLRPALVLFVLLSAITGLVYPLAMTGIAQVLFPHPAGGSLVERDGKVIGSELIGQNFTSDKYFHGRPSATTDTDPNDSTKTIAAPYNAANSAGSNAGPTAKGLVDRVKDDTAKLKAENPDAPVPVDLVTTSASGLDPHISPAGADFQVPRVAKARALSPDQLRQLVAAHTQPRFLGLFGEPVVNVLELNLALDANTGKAAADAMH